MTSLNGKKILVVGLGISGASALTYLEPMGCELFAADTRVNPPGVDELKSQFPLIPFYCGALQSSLLKDMDIVVLSPGVGQAHPVLQEYVAQGGRIIGDIELFADVVNAPVIAITGTNGKSTVTTLVGEMAKQAGMNVAVGGNLGAPALQLLDDAVELYVLELSSFQLETTYSLAPVCATILNVTPDHLDRYPDMHAYAQAKSRIFTHTAVAIYNRADEATLPNPSIPSVSFGLSIPSAAEDYGLILDGQESFLARGQEKIINTRDLALKGEQNWENALAAIALADAADIPREGILAALRSFSGLPHRCEFVANINHIDFINDSKGTNVSASLAALRGIGKTCSGKVILIAGGQGKGADFYELRGPVGEFTRCVIVLGEDKAKIVSHLEGASLLHVVNDMQEAVAVAVKNALPGDTVLLSPACASLDMYKNFMHRGEDFANQVRAYSNGLE